MWDVGLDWADTHHDVDLLNEVGKHAGARRFSHSHEGLDELKQFLLSFPSRPEELVYVLETTHRLLLTFLLEAGIPVYPVNPKTINGLRKVAGAKTDRIDARLVAKVGYVNLAQLRRLEPESSTVQELKTLTRDQDALIQMQTRLVNQLTACLKEYSPVALHLCTTVQQHSTLVFLQIYPTPQAAQAASLEEILATLHKARHTTPTQVASEIVEELHRPHLVANSVTVRTKSRLMLSLVKHLLVVVQEIAGYEKVVRPLFLTQKDHEIWSSLPRAGSRLAPRLLAEWGDDRTRYADANSVQELAGTAPVPFQSGHYARAHQRFACVKPWRNDLSQFAWQSTLSEP
jgi:transposase